MSLSKKKYDRHMQKQLTIDQELVSIKLRPLPDEYQNPFRINDCEVCYNPLSCDLYNDCTFFCKYCFIRNRLMSLYSAFYDNWKPDKVRPANFKIVEKKFKHAFSRNKKATGETLALRWGVPIHFGVLTDNFQPIEKHYGLTKRFLKYIKEYDYPLIISTKSDLLLRPDYFKAIMEIENLIIQVSFSTVVLKTSKKIDGFAPSPMKRLEVLRQFKASGVRTVMRMAPIISPITDIELHDSINAAVEHEAIDAVLMKGFFIGANKTVSGFFKKEFGIDVYDYYKQSGTLPYDGCNVCYHPQKQNLFTVKAINLCKKLGIDGMADTIMSPVVSTMHHCCGGDGLKGFNPHEYEDLAKVDNPRYNLNNVRYWMYLAWKKGKLKFSDYERIKPLNKTHKGLIDEYFYSGLEKTWCTFLKIEEDRYVFDYLDPFYRQVRKLQKLGTCLEEDEGMETQKKFVDVV